MSDIKLGSLKEITDLRSVWMYEAQDFTPWLAQNMSILGNELGIDIDVIETESSVGSFNVDIYAQDADTNKKIIIENQLEETDHDHLGKLITYASGKDANLVIWVVKKVRSEHRSAIEWLNNNTNEDIGFFLCEIKLYQIGDSLPAPLFSVIERPNDWAKVMKSAASASAISRAMLPKIRDMLSWGVVHENDVLYPDGHPEENGILLANGHVRLSDGDESSIQKWLCGVYGWTSVETYKYTIHKVTGKSLSKLRKEYMDKKAEESQAIDPMIPGDL